MTRFDSFLCSDSLLYHFSRSFLILPWTCADRLAIILDRSKRGRRAMYATEVSGPIYPCLALSLFFLLFPMLQLIICSALHPYPNLCDDSLPSSLQLPSFLSPLPNIPSLLFSLPNIVLLLCSGNHILVPSNSDEVFLCLLLCLIIPDVTPNVHLSALLLACLQADADCR